MHFVTVSFLETTFEIQKGPGQFPWTMDTFNSAYTATGHGYTTVFLTALEGLHSAVC